MFCMWQSNMGHQRSFVLETAIRQWNLRQESASNPNPVAKSLVLRACDVGTRGLDDLQCVWDMFRHGGSKHWRQHTHLHCPMPV